MIQPMAHVHRFYVPDLESSASLQALPPEEAHHAAQVARVRAGDCVALFDGRGTLARGVVERASKREVLVNVEAVEAMGSPSPRLILAVAWLNRDKAVEHIITHGTELGVHRFVFFRGGHSQKDPKESPKWQRWAIEACKQCGRNALPEFAVYGTMDDVLLKPLGRPVVLAMDGRTQTLREVPSQSDLVLFVGPEGDFTPDELAALRTRDALSLSLGASTFRSEVAATIAATLIAQHWGRLAPR